ncbi:MAG TPA: hypothetical protein VJ917_06955, partial [Saprospiraceae bacterium]|nr:hypothetical protein [Saprospiraceae bacterium]
MKQHLNKDILQSKKRTFLELPKDFFERLASEELNAVARALSLLESDSTKYEKDRGQLLEWIYGQQIQKARRIGITGSPGVGKSSFIEAFGQMICEEGFKVAV